jgi:hypothetical protein
MAAVGTGDDGGGAMPIHPFIPITTFSPDDDIHLCLLALLRGNQSWPLPLEFNLNWHGFTPYSALTHPR